MAADGSTNIVTYTQVSIAQDALTERLVGEYLTTAEVPMPAIGADGLPSGWRFTDSAGNQWLYAGAAADGGIPGSPCIFAAQASLLTQSRISRTRALRWSPSGGWPVC